MIIKEVVATQYFLLPRSNIGLDSCRTPTGSSEPKSRKEDPMFKSYEEVQSFSRKFAADLLKLQGEIAERHMALTRETLDAGMDVARQSADKIGRFWLGALSVEKNPS
jgi:hypothetical protein